MADTEAIEKATGERSDWILVDDAEGFEQTLRFRPPKTGAIAYLAARMSSSKSRPNDIAKFINHMVDLMDEDTQEVVEGRLFDVDDEFDIDGLMDLWGQIVEDEAGRPTESPDASSASRQKSGKKSTGNASVRASTSRRSPSTGS